MQGHLLEKHLSCTIDTECAHCRRPIQIELDSDLTYRVAGEEAAPLVHVPLVDVHALDEPSIIDAF